MEPSPPLRRLAFGSCRKQTLPQTIFDAITAARPDVWLWTGDAVYPTSPTTPQRLHEAYALAAPADARLHAAVPIVDGVYDDHDFGENDGGRHNPLRHVARTLFLDNALRASAADSRRTAAAGAYASRSYGTPPRQVKVLLLDTRWARDDHAIPSVGASPRLFKPGYCAALLRLASAALGVGRDHAGRVLAEEQWEWLERELVNSSAAAHLVVSSVQVLTSSPLVESWAHFPRERRRLLRLLARAAPPATLLLSGDVHYAELLGPPPHLLEATSSGLTHSCGEHWVGALACRLVLRLFSSHRLGGGSYTGLNFGSIDFDWEGASMRLRLHGHDGAVVLSHSLPLGASAAEEARRWRAAELMPSVFDVAAPVCAALLAVGGVMLLLLLLLLRRAQRARRGGRKHHPL
ncbi:hypothetical protein AB1Y20_011010 [Prymnesium parvum]|uniref:PhoD-like phosphatase metallophosphatase domain-containing protein n=1 Tax=Prymnesium parvum TaxID=97485 RepID=A0AB34IM16_PRYPA